MGTGKGIGNKIVLLATVAFSVFFLVATTLSSLTYSRVIDAQQEMALEEPSRSVTVLANGTLRIDFGIRFDNPGKFPVHVSSMSWYVQVSNLTGAPAIITLARVLYTGGGELVVAQKDGKVFEFVGFVTGEVLSSLKGFLNYSNSQGEHYTLETAPYYYRFEIGGWLDDFKHDYLREDYLNKLVSFDLVHEHTEGGQ